jgi:hypothetical protein
MGPGATSVTVRLYAADHGGFRLRSAAGREMDGYASPSLIRLHSPIPGQIWVLLSGFMTGANGPSNEIRVYVYDGTKFRSMWADDQWGNFAIRVTDRGFTVSGDYYTGASGRNPPPRHDLYLLAKNGVRRVPAKSRIKYKQSRVRGLRSE